MSGPVTGTDAAPLAVHDAPTAPCVELSDSRDEQVGNVRVRRALPRRGRRTVGAWCFADHMGPADVTERSGLDVGAHPHTGLQTVTWLVDGQVLHRDSLGTEQLRARSAQPHDRRPRRQPQRGGDRALPRPVRPGQVCAATHPRAAAVLGRVGRDEPPASVTVGQYATPTCTRWCAGRSISSTMATAKSAPERFEPPASSDSATSPPRRYLPVRSPGAHAP